MTTLEDQHRFQIRGLASCEDAQLVFRCSRCGLEWTFVDRVTLAVLDQIADEHAEVCR